MSGLTCKYLLLAVVSLALPAASAAQQVNALDAVDENPARVPLVAPAARLPAATSSPVVQPLPGQTGENGEALGEIQPWTLSDARALLTLIEAIGTEGLNPADYHPEALSTAIFAGEGPLLDQAASDSLAWLIEDLRDGRTPMEARRQWHVVDPDRDLMPTARIMAQALASHDIEGVVAKLAPTHPDYAVLRAALRAAPQAAPQAAPSQPLAETPEDDARRIAMIRANMDRWRWLPHDLGKQYLIVNVPEFELRLMVNGKAISTYRTIVGKPGRTATPQFGDQVEGIIFNPTWNVPQSIVVGEGLGRRVLNNPRWAKSKGYVATRSGGRINIVQQPGPGNALGIVKLDMPNPYSVFMHDTPSKNLFDNDARAYSHGCIRTDRALELAITLGILRDGASKEDAIAISNSRKYTKVPLAKPIPVYVTYFTMGRNIDGELTSFDDIYDRDAPVIASLERPRVFNRARMSSKKVATVEALGA